MTVFNINKVVVLILPTNCRKANPQRSFSSVDITHHIYDALLRHKHCEKIRRMDGNDLWNR